MGASWFVSSAAAQMHLSIRGASGWPSEGDSLLRTVSGVGDQRGAHLTTALSHLELEHADCRWGEGRHALLLRCSVFEDSGCTGGIPGYVNEM